MKSDLRLKCISWNHKAEMHYMQSWMIFKMPAVFVVSERQLIDQRTDFRKMGDMTFLALGSISFVAVSPKIKLLCISPLSFHKQNPNYSATDAPWSKTSWCRVICCLRKWRYFHLILGTRNCLILIQFFAFFRQNRLVFRLGSYLSQKRLYTTMKWGSRKKDNST